MQMPLAIRSELERELDRLTPEDLARLLEFARELKPLKANGHPVTGRKHSLSELPTMLRGIRHHLTREEADEFSRDFEDARRFLNASPIRNPWES